MSLIRVTFLYCDGPECPRRDGEQEPFAIDPTTYGTPAEQRQEAKRAGWVRRKGKDLCGLCAIDSTAKTK